MNVDLHQCGRKKNTTLLQVCVRDLLYDAEKLLFLEYREWGTGISLLVVGFK